MEVIKDISPRDDMFHGHAEQYFRVGGEAVELLHRANLVAGIEHVRTILDLPSGYGRVMRALKAAFPQAQLTACDIDRAAVDFCVWTFGAEPVYASVDPRDISFGKKFDVIWSGSLFTHLETERFMGFLELFESYLATDGLLVLTTNGHHAHRMMRRLLPDWDASGSKAARSLVNEAKAYFPIPQEAVPAAVESYEREGFAYFDYDFMDRFGATLSSPAWVCKQLERLPNLRLITYLEQGWDGVQDVLACQRRAEPPG